ncbi:MAG: hypothetical protein IJY13_04265, partial [Clostridia bacterium]|nr:hypothetical protein [Clostridia bacterium]
MKKLLVIALCLVMLLTFTACSSYQFLSNSKVNNLVEKYSENGKLPQMEMTFSYETSKNSTPMQIKVVYELLLDKAPISVISFINLLNDGRYNNVVVDSKSSNQLSIGRFTYTEPTSDKDENSKPTEISKNRLYLFAKADATFAGEFKNNNFKPYGKVAEGDDGFTKFEMFSLAMYHETANSKSNDKEQQAEYKRAYNSANGRLILSLGTTQNGDAPSYKDYAVFARPVSFSVSIDGGEFSNPVAQLDAYLLNQIRAVSSKTITINGTNYAPIQIDVSFQMVAGSIDWANIKDNYLVDAE